MVIEERDREAACGTHGGAEKYIEGFARES
jgi:hypothetical protein